MSAEPYFELRDIRKHYALRRSFFQRFGGEARTVNAVDGVSFQVPQGSIFGLVGESGSGKSTLAQIMVGLLAPNAGQLIYRGHDVATLDAVGRRAYRRGVSGHAFLAQPSQTHPPRLARSIIGPKCAG